MRFLFLYTEIAEYFLACCKELSKHAEVHVIRWPVNKEAPFLFDKTDNITLYSKNDYTYTELNTLVKSINPTTIFCSGWIDKDYLKLTKQYYNKVPTVMTCDTKWQGTVKQKINCWLSPFKLLKCFSHAWVPGKAQKEYTLNLGFTSKNIETEFYSCDLPYFESIYQTQKDSKKENFPKRFLYVGRYYDFKGLPELWQAFIELQHEQPNEWELWCLGTGDLQPAQHPKIKHFGFVQPKNLANYIQQTGVFVLPSRYEPWGVVAHEYAASGFPLLLSDEVGAKEKFLQQSKNGFEFKNGNVIDLKIKLQQFINGSNEELLAMSSQSNQLAQAISPVSWAQKALGFSLK